MSNYRRDFLRDAALLGFRFDGVNGRNHLRLHHPNGTRFWASSTPGDWRSAKNALAVLQRLSGRRLPHQKNGKPKHRRHTQQESEQPE